MLVAFKFKFVGCRRESLAVKQDLRGLRSHTSKFVIYSNGKSYTITLISGLEMIPNKFNLSPTTSLNTNN